MYAVRVAVEAPRTALLDYFKARLIVPIENLLGDPTRRRAVYQRQRLGTVPLHADNGDRAIVEDAPYGGVGLECFEIQIATSDLRLCASASTVPTSSYLSPNGESWRLTMRLRRVVGEDGAT